MIGWLDFEYRDVNTDTLEVICCSVHYETPEGIQWQHYDLQKDPGRNLFRRDISRCDTLGCHNSGAEAAALQSIGLDPHAWRWRDTYWLALLAVNGMRSNSGGEDKRPLCGLVDTCRRYGIQYDWDKDKTLNLILRGGPWSGAEWRDIVAYNSEDTQVLKPLHDRLVKEIEQVYGYTHEKILDLEHQHAMWIIRCAEMTLQGIPLDIDACYRLTEIESNIEKSIRHEVNSTLYPLYRLNGTLSYDRMIRWLDTLTDLTDWPLSSGGGYSLSEKTFRFKRVPETLEFLKHKHRIAAVSRWQEGGSAYEKIGPDDRLRVWLNPYGTISGRNAPPARYYIFAQSSWLRCLIRPDPGYVILAADYSAEEVSIAAYLSNDSNMILSAQSGDPYLSLAKLAGAVPEDATKKSHKHVRDLFKSTMLGLQYGMGLDTLQIKLSTDMGEAISAETTKQLYDLHKRVYRKYWNWLYDIGGYIKTGGAMQLRDGWGLRTDSGVKAGSAKNWPIQGTASAVLRKAFELLENKKLYPFGAVHDSIYLHVPVEVMEESRQLLVQCMQEAASSILDGPVIHVDTKILTRQDCWVEDKAINDIKTFGTLVYPSLKETEHGWKIGN